MILNFLLILQYYEKLVVQYAVRRNQFYTFMLVRIIYGFRPV